MPEIRMPGFIADIENIGCKVAIKRQRIDFTTEPPSFVDYETIGTVDATSTDAARRALTVNLIDVDGAVFEGHFSLATHIEFLLPTLADDERAILLGTDHIVCRACFKKNDCQQAALKLADLDYNERCSRCSAIIR